MKNKAKIPDKIILGIDPGIADTGYGVIGKNENGDMVCLDYGTIKTRAGLELPDRLALLFNRLDRLVKKYKPKIIAIEQLFFCKNVKTALVVGQARGVALLAGKINKTTILEFTPLEVKQAVSSYGRAEKSQVQKMVKMLLRLDDIPKPDDAADALAIAICAANSA